MGHMDPRLCFPLANSVYEVPGLSVLDLSLPCPWFPHVAQPEPRLKESSKMQVPTKSIVSEANMS